MLQILKTDYTNPKHGDPIISLMDQYAAHITGKKDALSDHVKTNLLKELAKRPGIHTLLAFWNHAPSGFTIGIESFSTFQCKPLINVHDVFVHEDYRGKGISKALLLEMEAIGKQLDCCKMTLEVLEKNKVAINLYNSLGYVQYEQDPALGRALFYEKKL